MSEENVETVRRLIEDFNRTGEFDESTLDPGTVWDLSHSPFPDAGVYRGVDGVRAWFSGLADAFGDFKYEVEKTRDAGAQVVVLLRITGRGPTSGLAVDYRLVPVFTFHDGKIVRMERFDDCRKPSKRWACRSRRCRRRTWRSSASSSRPGTPETWPRPTRLRTPT